MSDFLRFGTYSLRFKPDFALTPGEVTRMLGRNVSEIRWVLLLYAYVDGSFIVTLTNYDAAKRLVAEGVRYRNTVIRFMEVETKVKCFAIEDVPRTIPDYIVAREISVFGRVLLLENEHLRKRKAIRIYIELSRAVPATVEILGRSYRALLPERQDIEI